MSAVASIAVCGVSAALVALGDPVLLGGAVVGLKVLLFPGMTWQLLALFGLALVRLLSVYDISLGSTRTSMLGASALVNSTLGSLPAIAAGTDAVRAVISLVRFGFDEAVADLAAAVPLAALALLKLAVDVNTDDTAFGAAVGGAEYVFSLARAAAEAIAIAISAVRDVVNPPVA